jgi:hypothetical protein
VKFALLLGALLAIELHAVERKPAQSDAHHTASEHAAREVKAGLTQAEGIKTDAMTDITHDHARHPLPEGSEASLACRSGAFLEASAILNSVIEITQRLPHDSPAAVRSELDIILYTALKQAHSEVACVQTVLTHGYHQSFAEIIERATVLAKARGLKPEVIQLGDQTARALRQKE